MHRFLHGIRRSSCWPVANPLAYARLPCLLPFSILNQPSGYGDLLQSGDEANHGDLLPQSGDEDEEGDLPPQSGESNGEGIPPSQGNEAAVLCDLQPQINWQLCNTLDIFSKQSHGIAFTFVDVFHEAHGWSPTRWCPVKALRHGCFMKMFAADAIQMLLLLVAEPFVFDPGGLSCLHEEFPHACQPASTTSHRRSTFAADHQHILDVGTAPMLMVNKYADTSVHAHIHVGQTKVLQEVVGGNQLGLSYCKAKCRFSANQCTVLLPMKILQDDTVSYGRYLWLNGRHSGESAATHFLIPLRGSISMQWNDEDFDEDAAAVKKKNKRRMLVLRLLYLMKDLLDPG